METRTTNPLAMAGWAATGVVDTLCITVGNALATSGQAGGDYPTGEQVLHNINNASTTNVIGMMLEVLGFVAFMAFLGYLVVRLRGAGVAGAAALVAGFTMLIVKFGSAAPVVALTLERKQISPANALLLVDLNGGAFVASWLAYAVFVGLLAVELRSMRAIGRVSAGIGILAGVTGLVTGLLAIVDPLHANPVPFLVGVLWIAYVSVRETLTARSAGRPVVHAAAGLEPATASHPA